MVSIGSKTLSVAIVEADDGLGHSIRSLLEAHGYVAVVYPSAEAFLASTSDHNCLVIDAQLSGLGAIDLLEHMQNYGPVMPVVVISANLERWKKMIKAGGIEGVLDEPLSPCDLLAKLDKLSDES